jgi:hypothetical protein
MENIEASWQEIYDKLLRHSSIKLSECLKRELGIHELGLHGVDREKHEKEQRKRDLWISPEEIEEIKSYTNNNLTSEVRQEIFGEAVE